MTKLVYASLVVFVALMIIFGIFGYPNTWGVGDTFSGLSYSMSYMVATILIILGAVLLVTKNTAGVIFLALGLLALWLGPNNVTATGNNLGMRLNEASRSINESGPLPTTGRIYLERRFQNPQPFALADTYRRVDVPPGTELCADPIDQVELGSDSSPAVKYVRSKQRGQVVHVNFYYMLYGQSCVLLPPTPDRQARSQNNLNRQTHASG